MCQGRDETAPEVVVFRLGHDGPKYTHGELKPSAADFRLTNKELEEAKDNDDVGGLSVWDRDKTSLAQARKIMEIPGKPTTKSFAYVLRVEDVCALEDYKLHVCRDPLRNNPNPGADGHCLIANAYSPDDETRRAIRACIMRAAKYYDETAAA